MSFAFFQSLGGAVQVNDPSARSFTSTACHAPWPGRERRKNTP